MAESLKTKILLRNDTLANWSSRNPVISKGEAAVVFDGSRIRVKFGDGVTVFNELPYVADYDADIVDLEAAIAQLYLELAKKVDKEIVGANGTAKIFNESDGGGAQFVGTNGVVAYVGTHDSIGGEIGTQIYVDKANGTESTIIDVTQNGAYYTKGAIKPGSERDVEANEIAVKGDIAAEATAREAADAALSSDISTEASTRATADTNLQTAITNEANRAQRAEAALSDEIVTESAIREETDQALLDKIGTEKSQRISADNALSDRISNLEARGRFLSAWNSVTGLPTTEPATIPYQYKSGDYFIVETVGATNYRPEGSQYTGAASTTVETEEVGASDFYTYDGTKWILIPNAQKTVNFSQIAGAARDNASLASEFGAVDTAIANLETNKLNVLPKVDDPTDPGYGWEYHIPYRFDFTTDAEKLNVKLHTLTLDNKLTKMQFDTSVPSATSSNAGLMSAADKSKLDGMSGDVDEKIAAERARAEAEEAKKLEKYTVTVNGKDGQYVGDAKVPVYFDADVAADKITVNSYSITLDTNKEQVAAKYSLDIPAASTVSAGLMSAADKAALAGKQEQLTAGAGISATELANNVVKLDLTEIILDGGNANS